MAHCAKEPLSWVRDRPVNSWRAQYMSGKSGMLERNAAPRIVSSGPRLFSSAGAPAQWKRETLFAAEASLSSAIAYS